MNLYETLKALHSAARKNLFILSSDVNGSTLTDQNGCEFTPNFELSRLDKIQASTTGSVYADVLVYGTVKLPDNEFGVESVAGSRYIIQTFLKSQEYPSTIIVLYARYDEYSGSYGDLSSIDNVTAGPVFENEQGKFLQVLVHTKDMKFCDSLSYDGAEPDPQEIGDLLATEKANILVASARKKVARYLIDTIHHVPEVEEKTEKQEYLDSLGLGGFFFKPKTDYRSEKPKYELNIVPKSFGTIPSVNELVKALSGGKKLKPSLDFLNDIMNELKGKEFHELKAIDDDSGDTIADCSETIGTLTNFLVGEAKPGLLEEVLGGKYVVQQFGMDTPVTIKLKVN